MGFSFLRKRMKGDRRENIAGFSEVYFQCVYVSPAPGDYLRTKEAVFGPTTDRIVYQIPNVRDDVMEAEEN